MISIEHLHPIVVHFPIVFFLTLAALDIVASFRGRSITGRSAVGNASAGLAVLSAVTAIAAFSLGDEALEIAVAGGFSSEIAEIHETLGMAVAALFSVWAVIRAYLWLKDKDVQGGVKWLIPVIETGGAALVVATAYYGGVLVYELGVNVMRAVQ